MSIARENLAEVATMHHNAEGTQRKMVSVPLDPAKSADYGEMMIMIITIICFIIIIFSVAGKM